MKIAIGNDCVSCNEETDGSQRCVKCSEVVCGWLGIYMHDSGSPASQYSVYGLEESPCIIQHREVCSGN